MSHVNVYHRRMTQPQLRAAIAQDLNPLQPTLAELAVGANIVNGAYWPFDMRRYGWTPDGATDNSAALATGVAVVNVAGGELVFPAGQGNFSTFPVLDTMQSIVFRGVGATNSGAARGTTLAYTGTGAGVAISALSTQGIQFKNLQVIHTSAAFTGTYIKFGNDGTHGDSAFCSVLDCVMGATPGSGVSHLDLDKAINFTCERTIFFRGKNSIKGQSQAGGSYSVNNKFIGCEWFSSISVPLLGGGETWNFIACVFEPLTSGVAAAFDYGSALVGPTLQGLNFQGCWFGDVVADGGTWINYIGEDLSVKDSMLSLGGHTGNIINLNGVKGVTVQGNRLAGGGAGTGINFQAACTAVSVTNNTGLGTLSAVFGTIANAPRNMVYNPNDPLQPPPTGLGSIAANGYEIDAQGVIEQWGTVAITVGTPATVTFATNGIAFPNACWNVTPGVGNPSGTNDTVDFTPPSTTSVTFNLRGTAGNTATIHWRAKGN